MPRPKTAEPSTPFALWLRDVCLRWGVDDQNELAARTGYRQSTISNYMTGKVVPDPEKIKHLVRTILPPTADEYVAREVLEDGLRASVELERDMVLDEVRDAGYSDLPEEARGAIVDYIRLRHAEERRRRSG